ncbi:MAG: hypothetical protein B6I18_04275 [Bacteroidetes bacterium 4572_112]|nr:MAG: hypothetical protein B6I18_04275 [Bacteroidetes bacterium 4572_112]
MLIIIDKKLPQQAKDKLQEYGEIYELETSGIVYEAISGHPDIFIFQHTNKLVIAPQSPLSLVIVLNKHKIKFQFGDNQLGNKYPLTTAYNVSYNNDVVIGNNKFCDPKILELTKDKTWIQSKQSYARCNTLIIDNTHIISSEKSLQKNFPEGLFINPNEIILEGFDYGFIGGCLGIYKKNIFVIGSLKHHKQGEQIRDYCNKLGYTIIELYDGELIDGGGIFFMK